MVSNGLHHHLLGMLEIPKRVANTQLRIGLWTPFIRMTLLFVTCPQISALCWQAEGKILLIYLIYRLEVKKKKSVNNSEIWNE